VNRDELGRKLARLATNAVVAHPWTWRVFRPLIRLQFDTLAPRWDEMRVGDHLASYERALDAIAVPPARALDVGTGTGDGAAAVAYRFPRAEVIGVDLSDAMIEHARRKLPEELQGRVRFERADASALPFADESFDLVALANMIPFFDEVARLVVPGGHALFAFSGGAATPIYVAPERLRSELGRRGFTEFADFVAGSGTALLARKAQRS
jgi:SAM-dependent methyltransferase